MSKPVAMLNSSIVTAYGSYEYVEISLDEARELVRSPEGVLSAIGHASTAQVLTTLLGIEVPVNRIQFAQEVGQTALVFRLNGRPEEGKILSVEEIGAMGYSFSKLTRLS